MVTPTDDKVNLSALLVRRLPVAGRDHNDADG